MTLSAGTARKYLRYKRTYHQHVQHAVSLCNASGLHQELSSMRQGSTQQEADVEKTLAIHKQELRERIVRSIQRAHKDFSCSNLVGVCSCSLAIEIVRETK